MTNRENLFTPDTLRRLQVVLLQGENRLALIDPEVLVDGEPIQHLTFDLKEQRSLGDFFQVVLGPSLIASGMTLADFLAKIPEKAFSDGQDNNGSATSHD